jgi:hypothetical protein
MVEVVPGSRAKALGESVKDTTSIQLMDTVEVALPRDALISAVPLVKQLIIPWAATDAMDGVKVDQEISGVKLEAFSPLIVSDTVS